MIIIIDNLLFIYGLLTHRDRKIDLHTERVKHKNTLNFKYKLIYYDL